MAVQYGDKVAPLAKPNRRHGMTVAPDGGPGSEKTLGHWPADFQTKYQPGSNVGRAGAERAKGLKVGQRLHEQFSEIKSAKAANREPSVPDVSVRRQRAREDQKTLNGIRNARLEIETAAIVAKDNLKPWDYSKHDPLRAEYRQMMRQADDKTRAELLRKPAYREALFQGDPSLSGVSEKQYDQLWEIELRTRFPDQMTAYDDSMTAVEALGHVYDAADTALRNELKAIGEPIFEPGAPTPKPAWE
jgi:hypothetical protein